jgi:glycosyltransferase involved in cell wall biosynthesis
MKQVLFVHNNFPAQFVHVARALASHPDVKVAAIGSQTARALPGVKLLKYSTIDGNVALTHPFARRFDLECQRAEQVLYAASNLTQSGFAPDVVVAHPGWGEALPLRAAFPKARLIAYCEFFYRAEGADFGFDSEFPQSGIDGRVRLHLKNASTLLALAESDAAISPTEWQRSTYPAEIQRKISVLHEGVDTEFIKPVADAEFRLSSGRVLRRGDEVVTFVIRSFEPLRGYHIFMRALPEILATRPKAQILVIGGAGSPYGISAPDGQDWKSIFYDEVAGKVDASRIHFTGQLSYQNYLSALQISSAHVYLTYPFVLSWSLLEAMSAECLVIGSDTAPVREVIDDSNGVLVPFFDPVALADAVIAALAHPRRFQSRRKHARKTVLDRFDMERQCVPNLLAFLGIDSPAATRTRRKLSAAAAD